MSKIGFLTNKYSISVLILLAIMGVDVLLHRGMSRVMIPEKFSEKIQPYQLLPLQKPIVISGKSWVHAVNTIEQIKNIEPLTAGFECDLYYDTSKNELFIYHDSLKISEVTFTEILNIYKQKNLGSSIWLDLKNINSSNAELIVQKINELRDTFSLSGRLLIESSKASVLERFSANNYFTSYYVPYFNPYNVDESILISHINSIADSLKKYPVSALSGYYFQYPALKKFFPNYPLLTWSDRSSTSIVSYSFNKQLELDSMVKVILYKH